MTQGGGQLPPPPGMPTMLLQARRAPLAAHPPPGFGGMPPPPGMPLSGNTMGMPLPMCGVIIMPPHAPQDIAAAHDGRERYADAAARRLQHAAAPGGGASKQQHQLPGSSG
jgi:hypothetical protein